MGGGKADMKQEPRQLGYLPLEVIKKEIAMPSEERMRKGPVVIIECNEDIPCDPCVESCKIMAITKESLTASPIVDYEKCTGCALCVASCPGLAIFIVDNSPVEKAIVYIPHEMLPVPQKGDKGDALDRSGKRIGSAEVARVRKGTRGTTVLEIVVEKDLAMNVRAIRIRERSNG
jgi:Fe-S-cluster-containing hydrogenase component 2